MAGRPAGGPCLACPIEYGVTPVSVLEPPLGITRRIDPSEVLMCAVSSLPFRGAYSIIDRLVSRAGGPQGPAAPDWKPTA